MSEGEQFADLFYSYCVFCYFISFFPLISIPPLFLLLVKIKGVDVCMKAQPSGYLLKETSMKYKLHGKHNIQAASSRNFRIDGRNTSEAHGMGK